MNGSLNSGGVRSVGLLLSPETELATRPKQKAATARAATSALPPSIPVEKVEVATGNPVILLGSIERDLEAMKGIVKELPRSPANYENRLRALLASAGSVARNVRGLLEDEARRLERDV